MYLRRLWHIFCVPPNLWWIGGYIHRKIKHTITFEDYYHAHIVESVSVSSDKFFCDWRPVWNRLHRIPHFMFVVFLYFGFLLSSPNRSLSCFETLNRFFVVFTHIPVEGMGSTTTVYICSFTVNHFWDMLPIYRIRFLFIRLALSILFSVENMRNEKKRQCE